MIISKNASYHHAYLEVDRLINTLKGFSLLTELNPCLENSLTEAIDSLELLRTEIEQSLPLQTLKPISIDEAIESLKQAIETKINQQTGNEIRL